MNPVFLLKKKNGRVDVIWKSVLYLYILWKNQKILSNASNKKKKNMPVIVIRGGGKSGRIVGKEDATCGPAEFLRYIKNAEYVVTNSIHRTAFSLIFEKKFLCTAHSTRNTGIINILQLINEEEKMISSNLTVYDDKIIEGNKYTNILERYINISKDYLLNNLRYVKKRR